MQRHKIGLLKHLFHAHHGDAELASLFGGDIGIERDNLHFQSLGASRYFGADLSQANNAEHFVAYLDSQEAILFPFPSFGAAAGGRDVTR